MNTILLTLVSFTFFLNLSREICLKSYSGKGERERNFVKETKRIVHIIIDIYQQVSVHRGLYLEEKIFNKEMPQCVIKKGL